jgi:cytochrome c oxidase assembly protein subunit 15
MTVDEFKRIYYYEYSHRMLGRLIGAVYALPMVYFLVTRRRVLRPYQRNVLLVISGLILGQGLLGWYMVQSGLDPKLVDEGRHPRVSQYRLAAHLGSAFVIFLLMLKQGFNLLPATAAIRALVSPAAAGSKVSSAGPAPALLLRNLRTFGHMTHGAAGLTFLTAMSGAIVAGLDAGMIYNTFPKMGLHWIPDDAWALAPWYVNFFENPTTAQLSHRFLVRLLSPSLSLA